MRLTHQLGIELFSMSNFARAKVGNKTLRESTSSSIELVLRLFISRSNSVQARIHGTGLASMSSLNEFCNKAP